ncbi:TetR/AcrR family transcriptional regulator [Streptococcus ictaluri]|uniref:Transcriptional regulator, TetR family n=1 Tax=Streptococcus ictaluri 707-05 TaxID=764299 RepID=G5K2T6_9STRE|nr:TetR/AcrR family transcriptional regulator [Streptococcus ictaluri]EHI69859.1 transcriptional regulator, TetR family [Streptococcus ictaluri 707-05]
MPVRQTETKNYLKEALCLLIAEKNFESISVSDLTQKAGINRSTSYLHYKDKTDMITQFKNDLFDGLYDILNDKKIYTDTEHVLKQTLTYITDNQEFVTALVNSQQLNFSQLLKDFIFQVLTSISHFQDIILAHYDIPYPYALEVYLASIEAIITYWISHGCQENNKEIAAIILAVIGQAKPIKDTPKSDRGI